MGAVYEFVSSNRSQIIFINLVQIRKLRVQMFFYVAIGGLCESLSAVLKAMKKLSMTDFCHRCDNHSKIAC